MLNFSYKKTEVESKLNNFYVYLHKQALLALQELVRSQKIADELKSFIKKQRTLKHRYLYIYNIRRNKIYTVKPLI